MRVKLNNEVRIRLGNKITENIIKIMDSKNISNKENKIDDYVKYLSKRTNIKEQKLKKYLSFNIIKYITIDDIGKIALALEVNVTDLFDDVA